MQENDNKKPETQAAEGAENVAPDAAAETEQAAAEGQAEEQADPRDAQIAELAAQLAEAKEQHLRALADAENTRRRAQREREEAAKYGAVGLARDLLNVADNLRRALDSASEKLEDPAVASLIEGLSMVEKELLSVLERHHVRPVPGVGEPFDHNFHQAVVELPSDEVEPGNVAQVLQTGYVLHDRLLRAGMVAVAKQPEEGGR